MPKIDARSSITAPIDEVWHAMLDIKEFPGFMSSVESVHVLEECPPDVDRASEWKVMLKGSILRWVQHERIDNEARSITFHQVDGDLALFDGCWSASTESDATVVHLEAEFEIGIPLVANLLNPVAQRSLVENQEEMLASLRARLGSR